MVADARGRVLTGVEDGRILRLDGLADPDAVRVEVVADTGGRPLGLGLLPDGPLWVALAGPRVPALDLLHRRAPAVRRAAARLAVRAPYRPPGTVAVLAFDDEGHVVHHLARRRSGFRMATSVCTAAGHLVLGSVWEPGIALCAAPDPK
ncbi:hypothetical protein TU94_02810 [Streptomyces cyaneogriseus subsp. noncyanogenus]|uniref:Strictosidine synthase n=1 Tax=Streptomyces cyaneogriseus subsp. noncyanogenus TaxID=477245 RepID=A0A0C5FVZ5_9ACTN|nr:hypothetical protein [Streptomyces cyaneogriseus]AJP00605.1 hypothetical protein TU94_02810 [Streptomyces cyaneogriseus subsp. noncyanogenus]